MTDLLTQWTPAEAQFLLHPRSNGKTLLQLTFRHLILKGAIRALYLRDQDDCLIARGEHFDRYQASPHEEPLLETIEIGHDHNLSMTQKQFFQLLSENIRSVELYRRTYFRDAYELKPYQERGFFARLLLGPSLNKAGKILSGRLSAELQEVSDQYERLLGQDPIRATRLIAQLGGYALLLPGFSEDKLRDIDPAMWDQIRKAKQSGSLPQKNHTDASDDYHDSGVDLFALWIWSDWLSDSWRDFGDMMDDHVSDTLDSGNGWGDSDGYGDGGGDSGCSGCGGCGGCGG